MPILTNGSEYEGNVIPLQPERGLFSNLGHYVGNGALGSVSAPAANASGSVVPGNSGVNPSIDVSSNDFSLDISGYDQASWDLAKTKELLEEQRAYNSAEAAKNREWQERMSNTAYQRAVQDLEAAGLNKWLAVTGGNGASASTPSGSTASSSSGDASTPNPILAKSLLQAMTSVINSAFGLIGKIL